MKSALYDLELRPYFQEAVDKFGLVKAEYIDWIIENTFTADGKEWGAEQVRRMNKLVWQNCLTDEGLLDPEKSFDDTFWFAIGKARRDARKAREKGQISRNFVGILTVSPPPPGYCEAGEKMARKILSSYPDLPYPGCPQRVCRCSWHVLSGSFDAEKIKTESYIDCRDEDLIRRVAEDQESLKKNRERLKELGVEINVTVTMNKDKKTQNVAIGCQVNNRESDE